ncbi:DUF1444 family protein [Exiguobacterium sp. SH3S2]|uniref:DUF1444 family protein n=1 Tax=unclassified Exiguobacterium TaxID=2644629 RepID=UPI0010388C73|nr:MULTISPECIES: DUF1444 family protein [unclassified Exiguobacterium]TCI27810.1 DUF1444 family protein [Exiguobacterium sp. SH5S4]TCI48832.1 DUF1444 family protein [Exiguobacterium sp. SH3S3]TCI63696.1 DUF1444 family protein [Exiguobacterium sp. SH3S2]TCI64819.1 DUF1444 family protein [Exiguobacterium sp. SH3S1]
MERNELRRAIERQFTDGYRTSYDRENEVLRIERAADRFGVNIRLAPLVAKAKVRGNVAVEEVVDYIKTALTADQEIELVGNEAQIFPVIRAGSFSTETKTGQALLTTPHTAETAIYYALDLGHGYRLIEERHLNATMTKERVDQVARDNVKKLPTDLKEDDVAGNKFYFLSARDGYEASRILNDEFLRVMDRRIEGDMLVGVPHQDVMIIADIRNDQGYDAMQQLMFDFFTNGRIPVTALAFHYEDGVLEPIFIVGKKNPPTDA